jgi:hypothetical protein
MNLEQFCELTRERIPTAREFVEFVESMGWRIAVGSDGAASLKADRTSPVALSLARMLGREPYRTNVLAVAQQRWREQPAAEPVPEPVSAPAPVLPSPAAISAAPPTPTYDFPAREWLWRSGLRFSETPDLFMSDPWHPPLEWYPAYGEPDWHPTGAFWWRFEGDSDWLPVPGRNPDRIKPPETQP